MTVPGRLLAVTNLNQRLSIGSIAGHPARRGVRAPGSGSWRRPRGRRARGREGAPPGHAADLSGWPGRTGGRNGRSALSRSWAREAARPLVGAVGSRSGWVRPGAPRPVSDPRCLPQRAPPPAAAFLDARVPLGQRWVRDRPRLGGPVGGAPARPDPPSGTWRSRSPAPGPAPRLLPAGRRRSERGARASCAADPAQNHSAAGGPHWLRSARGSSGHRAWRRQREQVAQATQDPTERKCRPSATPLRTTASEELYEVRYPHPGPPPRRPCPARPLPAPRARSAARCSSRPLRPAASPALPRGRPENPEREMYLPLQPSRRAAPAWPAASSPKARPRSRRPPRPSPRGAVCWTGNVCGAESLAARGWGVGRRGRGPQSSRAGVVPAAGQ